MDTENLLKGLNDRQREAVLATEGPVLILAGAGSGKTRVLVHRIAYLIGEKGVDPGSILAITFTNKAAGEMRQRVDAMVGSDAGRIWVMTFHAFCVRVLRQFADRIGYTRSFTIYDTDDQLALIRSIYKEKNLSDKIAKPKSVLGTISQCKNELLRAEDYKADPRNPYQQQAAKVFALYEQKLKENNAMDFDDLIGNAVRLLESDEDARGILNRRFRYLMVDEYQDTNGAQFKLVSLLTEEHRNLCVVGDDDQSIYRFRGADIRNILDFEKRYKDAEVIKLEENYRSTQTILDAANSVISNNKGRKSKTLWTSNGKGGPIRFIRYPTSFDEASGIVRDIKESVAGGKRRYSDHAVLYRTNAMSRLIEEKMLLMNVPYRIVGGVNFYSRREIKDVMAYLKLLVNSDDDLAAARVINVPKRGIGATTLQKAAEYASDGGLTLFDAFCGADRIETLSKKAADKCRGFAELILKLREESKALPVSETVGKVLEETGYVAELKLEGTDESKERIENLQEVVSKAVQYEGEAEEPSLEGFLEEVALIADIDTVDEDADCVLLMTLHAAKGLEFPAVHIAGMEENLFPSAHAVGELDGGEAVEEERRLAYVGITRAKEELTLTSAKERMVNGNRMLGQTSRFVMEIPRELVEMAGDEQPKRDPFAGSGDGGFYGAAFGRRFSDEASFGKPPRAFGRSSSYVSRKNSREEKEVSSLYSGKGAAKKPAPAADAAGLGYAEGDRVRHVKFGTGTVKEIRDGGRDFEVTVDFDGWGTKKLFAAFAKLKKL